MMPVCCAVIFDQGCMLAVQRGGDSDHPFRWEFPGGKIEPGESPEECIAREICEELGIRIRLIARLKEINYQYPGKLVCLIPFICEKEDRDLRLTEHIGLKWLKQEEIDLPDWQEADRLLIEKNREELLHRFRKDHENG